MSVPLLVLAVYTLNPVYHHVFPGKSPCWESHADVQNIYWIGRKLYDKFTEKVRNENFSCSMLDGKYMVMVQKKYGNCTENIWRKYGDCTVNAENIPQKIGINEYFPDTDSENHFV